jgi:hypothetical protein
VAALVVDVVFIAAPVSAPARLSRVEKRLGATTDSRDQRPVPCSA